MRVYQRCLVPHYWIVDPVLETLAVYRWMAEGYLLAQTAEGREWIRAEPFTAVELSVHGLLEGERGDWRRRGRSHPTTMVVAISPEC